MVIIGVLMYDVNKNGCNSKTKMINYILLKLEKTYRYGKRLFNDVDGSNEG